MRILLIHGVGHQERLTINRVHGAEQTRERDVKTLYYDQIADVKGPKAACRAAVLGEPSKTRAR